MTSEAKWRIFSPTATGGVGTFYEQHVAAWWLVQLLVPADARWKIFTDRWSTLMTELSD